MILYHGTNANYLSSIEKYGLKPKISNSLSNEGVFLTNNINKAASYSHGLEIILEILIDQDIFNDYQDLPSNRINEQFYVKNIIPVENIKHVFIPKNLLKENFKCLEEVHISKSILPHSITFFNDQILNIIDECENMNYCKDFAIQSLYNLNMDKLNKTINDLKMCSSQDECLDILKNIELFNDNDTYDGMIWCKFEVKALSNFKYYYNKIANISNIINKFSYIISKYVG